MTSHRPASGRGLQRVSTRDGFVLAVDLRSLDGQNPTDDDQGREVLAGLSPWASAVILPDTGIAQEWLDTEAVPRSLGVVRPIDAVTPEAGAQFAFAGADILIGSIESTAPSGWIGPMLGEVPAAALIEGVLDDAPHAIAETDLVVVGGPFMAAHDWRALDASFPVPWLVAPATNTFPETVALGRAAVSAGASGIAIGRELWTDLWADDGAVSSPGQRDEIRSRVVTLVGAIRSGMGTWHIDGSLTSDATQWFGARSFFYHGDIDRYEERMILIRAHDDEAALSAAIAEADEYAEMQSASTLDVVQISPIRTASEATGGGLVEWLEVYTQFHVAPSAADFLARFVPDDVG